MINPLTETLKTASEPYIAYHRAMILDGAIDGFIVYEDGYNTFLPLCFLTHHRHIGINVFCVNFETLEQARQALESVMWGHKKSFQSECICDFISQEEYSIFASQTYYNSLLGVNSHCCLQGDALDD